MSRIINAANQIRHPQSLPLLTQIAIGSGLVGSVFAAITAYGVHADKPAVTDDTLSAMAHRNYIGDFLKPEADDKLPTAYAKAAGRIVTWQQTLPLMSNWVSDNGVRSAESFALMGGAWKLRIRQKRRESPLRRPAAGAAPVPLAENTRTAIDEADIPTVVMPRITDNFQTAPAPIDTAIARMTLRPAPDAVTGYVYSADATFPLEDEQTTRLDTPMLPAPTLPLHRQQLTDGSPLTDTTPTQRLG